MQVGQVRLYCALGRSGISAFKREGDGATPLAAMRILSGFCKSPLLLSARCGLIMRRVRTDDGWCDTPDNANYNRLVRLPHPARTETLRRNDALYDILFVLDWNISCRRKKRGSAIFLHLAQENLKPTQGCIALRHQDMARITPYLGSNSKIIVMR